jgi:hypothetical protein
MKGYLQRIATQAAATQAKRHVVHPLVGSISAAARYERDLEALHEETLFTPASQPAQARSGTSRMSASPSRGEASAGNATQARLQEAFTPELAEREPFQPLLRDVAETLSARAPIASGQYGFQENLHNHGQHRLETESGGTRVRKEIIFKDASVANERRPSSPASLVPNSPTSETTMRELQSREARSPYPAETRRVRSASPFAATAGSMRGSDEIQINIGRIELTAVPQPAPSRAAAPPRKSINLEEYLRRRNGRNG